MSCTKCGYSQKDPFKDCECPKCGYNPAKEWAKATENAINELWQLFKKQNHSGHSAYTTVMGFVNKYFARGGHPAWIISQSPAIVTIGGPQKLDIYPLNADARDFTLEVKLKKKKK